MLNSLEANHDPVCSLQVEGILCSAVKPLKLKKYLAYL